MPRSAPGEKAGLPSTSTSPSVGVTRPAATLSSVDLPHPDGPTMQANWPSGTASEICCSARTSPRLVRKRMATSTKRISLTRGPFDIGKAPTMDQTEDRVGDQSEDADGENGRNNAI